MELGVALVLVDFSHPLPCTKKEEDNNNNNNNNNKIIIIIITIKVEALSSM